VLGSIDPERSIQILALEIVMNDITSDIDKVPVSVIIMTKNEEQNIRKCLRSVSKFDQIFVVDSVSEDQTCAIARELGAEVVYFRWNGKYPKKKQWCLENLQFKHDWVLYVDADEEVNNELSCEIKGIIENNFKHAGYYCGYNYVFLGRILQYGYTVYKLILFKRQKGQFIDYDDLDATNMWEVEGHYQPLIKGSIGTLKNRMLHNDHDNLYKYFARHNRYSDWESLILHKQIGIQMGKRYYLKKIFNKLPFRGLLAFLNSFLFKMGFLDGSAGFHFAMARAFYYWQINIKLKELISK
jgi:glycosyltransferase involved in cell wall biosynthesis